MGIHTCYYLPYYIIEFNIMNAEDYSKKVLISQLERYSADDLMKEQLQNMSSTERLEAFPEERKSFLNRFIAKYPSKPRKKKKDETELF